MAGQNDIDVDENAGAIDIAAHRDGYERFLGWAKFGVIVSFVTAAVVVLILAS